MVWPLEMEALLQLVVRLVFPNLGLRAAVLVAKAVAATAMLGHSL